MKTLTTALLFLFLTPVLSQAQISTFSVGGRVTDHHTKQPIRNVSVSVEGTYLGTTTDVYGNYQLDIPLSLDTVILRYSHLSYEERTERVVRREEQRINIKLKLNVQDLPEFTLTVGPEIVFGNQQYQIHDYVFMGDQVLLLAYEKRLRKSQLLLVNDQEEIQSTHAVPGMPVGLYNDCAGDNYLITQDYLFLVTKEEELVLTIADLNTFNHLIQKCVDESDPYFYFQQYGPGQLSVNYHFIDVKGGKRADFLRIIDEETLSAFSHEGLQYTDASFEKQLMHATANAKSSKENQLLRLREHEIRFMKELQFKPVYAPLAVVNEELLVFDHLHNNLLHLTMEGDTLDVVSIDYHHDHAWKEQLYIDEETEKVYAHYERKGYTILLEIDPKTGESIREIKLEHRYVERINVKNGVVYYLYRPYGSLQRKYLYKRRL